MDYGDTVQGIDRIVTRGSGVEHVARQDRAAIILLRVHNWQLEWSRGKSSWIGRSPRQ